MIIVRLSGGMGNQMFQYAFGRALSLKHGVPLKLNIQTFIDQARRPFRDNFAIRSYELGAFAIVADIAVSKDIPFIHRMYFNGGLMHVIDAIRRRIFFFLPGKEKSFRFNSRYLELGPNAYLVGEWQSPKYFAGYEAVIRSDFSLQRPLAAEIINLGQTIKSKNSVCLHVRRKDFIGHPLHGVGIEQSYYHEGLKVIAARMPIGELFVFSDDTSWCREHLSFPYPTTFVGDEYVGERNTGHFWLMQQCKHFIICNSSFSWWAAWLAGAPQKVVVAPKKWFADPSVDTADLIPPEWIRI